MSFLDDISVDELREEHKVFLTKGVAEGLRLLKEAQQVLEKRPELNFTDCKLPDKLSVSIEAGEIILKDLTKPGEVLERTTILAGIFMYRANGVLKHLEEHIIAISMEAAMNESKDDLLKNSVNNRKSERILN